MMSVLVKMEIGILILPLSNRKGQMKGMQCALMRLTMPEIKRILQKFISSLSGHLSFQARRSQVFPHLQSRLLGIRILKRLQGLSMIRFRMIQRILHSTTPSTNTATQIQQTSLIQEKEKQSLTRLIFRGLLRGPPITTGQFPTVHPKQSGFSKTFLPRQLQLQRPHEQPVTAAAEGVAVPRQLAATPIPAVHLPYQAPQPGPIALL